MVAGRAERAAIAWDPRSDRKAYVVWMAIIIAAIVAGFGVDFRSYLAEQPPPPAILHIHALAYVIWVGLVATQILLVERGDVRRHMTLGWATAALAIVMVPLGLVAALVTEVRHLPRPTDDPQFLALEFVDLASFSIFTVLGLAYRRNPAAHKRLMVLSAVSLADAGFARVWLNVFNITLPGLFGWWITYYWGTALILAAMIGWDLWRRGRPHPAVLAGGALLIGGEMLAASLYFSAGWKVLMLGLVKAWAWGG